MRKIIILFLLVLLPTVMAESINDTVQLNSTQLPYSGTITLDISAPVDSTSFFSLVSKDSNVNLTYPTSLMFTGVTSKPFEVNYTINSFSITNHTTLFNHFLISNSNSGEVNDYNLDFNITVQSLVDIPETDTFYLSGAGFNVTISTDLLPKSGSLIFVMDSASSTTVNFTRCDEWLTCPETFTFIDSSTPLIIPYTVPITSAGDYTQLFTMKNGDVESNGTVNFHLITPDVLIERFVWRDDCFTESGITEACLTEYIEFENKKLVDFVTQIRELGENKTNYKNVTEYIMIGSVNNETLNLLHVCQQGKESVQDKYDVCSLARDKLLNDKAEFDNRLKEMELDISTREQNINISHEQLVQEEHDKRVRTIRWSIFFCVLIALIMFYIIVDYRINQKWFWQP